MKYLLLRFTLLLLFFAHTMGAQTLPIDPDFGEAGISTLQALTGYKVMSRIKVLGDDKIIAAGSSQGFSNGSTHFTVLKYLADGSLDTGFGNGGAVYTPIEDASTAQDIAIQTDGKIVVAGSALTASGQVIALARYLPDGSLDNTFGVSGRLTIPVGETSSAKSLALQSDGRILVAGYSGLSPNLDFTLIRLSVDGTLDPTFGNTGIVISPMPSNRPTGEAVKVLVRPNGNIVIVGNYRSETMAVISTVFIAQYLSDGQFDTSFGNNGIWASPQGQNNWVDEAVLSPDGRLIAVGSRFDSNTSDFNLLSFAVNSDGTTDIAYGNNGFSVLLPNGRKGFTATGLAVLNTGAIKIGGGGSIPNNLNQDAVIIQLNPAGQYDLSFNQTGYGFFPLLGYFSATLDMDIQSNGRILQLVQYLEAQNNTAIFGYADMANVGTDETAQALLPASVFPNPVSDRSTLDYRLTKAVQVAIDLYDPRGRYIRQIQSPQLQAAGAYSIPFYVKDLPCGTYYVVLETSSGRQSIPVSIVR